MYLPSILTLCTFTAWNGSADHTFTFCLDSGVVMVGLWAYRHPYSSNTPTRYHADTLRPPNCPITPLPNYRILPLPPHYLPQPVAVVTPTT